MTSQRILQITLLEIIQIMNDKSAYTTYYTARNIQIMSYKSMYTTDYTAKNCVDCE